MKEHTIVLPLCAFGNIFYNSLILSHHCVIDINENYQKQTWRNRYDVLNAHGIQTLTIPVLSQKGQKISTSDIQIDNQLPWQRTHFRTIRAAYGSSPFYEHYIALIEPLFLKPYKRLLDFNQDSLTLVLNELNYQKSIQFSNEYISATEGMIDLRPFFKPSKFKQVNFKEVAYVQTFADRLGFIPNLSILDMLFNCGPESAWLIHQNESETAHFTIFDPQKNK